MKLKSFYVSDSLQFLLFLPNFRQILFPLIEIVLIIWMVFLFCTIFGETAQDRD